MNKKIAGLMVTFLILTVLLAACGSPATQAPTQAPPKAPAKTSAPNPRDPGEAINLTGDPVAGATVFERCQGCHGTGGKGGKANLGADSGVVPALNPIRPELKNADLKVFATNLDIIIEHGSKPKGSSPTRSMPAFGDRKMLTPQQIADVIAHIISLNP